MYKTIQEAESFLYRLSSEELPGDREILICAPFTVLAALKPYADRKQIALGAQDMFWEKAGAFTGEISAPMLLDAGCGYVLTGHSERRILFGETDQTVNLKLLAAVHAGLIPICCVGENLEQRQQGQAERVVRRQLEQALQGLGPDHDLVVAYEPVWAIGTGCSATPQDAQEMALFIRSCLAGLLPGREQDLRILYGGSVKPDMMRQLMDMPDVDGVLVGGASLEVEVFREIARITV
jgi:triosephosphate isomerase